MNNRNKNNDRNNDDNNLEVMITMTTMKRKQKTKTGLDIKKTDSISAIFVKVLRQREVNPFSEYLVIFIPLYHSLLFVILFFLFSYFC